MFRHSTIRLRFSPSLLLRSFSRSLWRGLRRRRPTPVWGQTRSLATPRATSTPPSESMRSFDNSTGSFNTASGADALV